MSDDLETTSQADSSPPPVAQPVQLALVVLVILGAFEVGRLIAGTLIGPWLAEFLLGTRTPVMVGGDFDLRRIAVEILAIALGVGLAALMAVPLVKVISRR